MTMTIFKQKKTSNEVCSKCQCYALICSLYWDSEKERINKVFNMFKKKRLDKQLVDGDDEAPGTSSPICRCAWLLLTCFLVHACLAAPDETPQDPSTSFPSTSPTSLSAGICLHLFVLYVSNMLLLVAVIQLQQSQRNPKVSI